MENYNDDIFEFNSDNNDEQNEEFTYDSISGLGESDYENEDLFNTEVNNDTTPVENNNFGISSLDSAAEDTNVEEPSFDYYTQDNENEQEDANNVETPTEDINEVEAPSDNVPNNTEEELPSVDENLETVSEPEEVESLEPQENSESDDTITLSDTPIEELNKLTEYEEDNIDSTDINDLFEKVSVNVKDASEIFRKNNDLKQKIDSRFDELKKLQSEIENSKKSQFDEINEYKEEVLNKLTEKKEEIEKRLNLLKDSQASLENEKQEFEEYKKKEQDNIDKVQKEVQAAYDNRREELAHIEDVLRKQKDALDEERSQLALDRIQYESDKNALANNLLKFNELVSAFKDGVSEPKE